MGADLVVRRWTVGFCLWMLDYGATDRGDDVAKDRRTNNYDSSSAHFFAFSFIIYELDVK
jgi:hypothetical protein